VADKLTMIDFSIPLAGLDQATSSLNQIASRTADVAGPIPPTAGSQNDNVDLSTQMVGLLQTRQNFESNTKVIKTEDQMTRSLLNVVG